MSSDRLGWIAIGSVTIDRPLKSSSIATSGAYVGRTVGHSASDRRSELVDIRRQERLDLDLIVDAHLGRDAEAISRQPRALLRLDNAVQNQRTI
jgi:hypothetical protein